MTYPGQPVPSTVYQRGDSKISDGKAVDVTVPESTTIVAGSFYLLDGFFGVSPVSVTTGAGETATIALQIEQGVYETDQIDATKTFAKGTAIYWDPVNNQFTETATSNRLAGRVTAAKDANNVIWFLLAPQV